MPPRHASPGRLRIAWARVAALALNLALWQAIVAAVGALSEILRG